MLESFISTGISTVESHATVESHGREYTLSESQVLEKVALRKESSTANIRESELGKNTVLEKIRQVRKMKWSRNTAVSPFPHQGTTRPREANSLVPSWMW